MKNKWKSKRTFLSMCILALIIWAGLMMFQLTSGEWPLTVALGVVGIGLIGALVYTVRRPWPWR